VAESFCHDTHTKGIDPSAVSFIGVIQIVVSQAKVQNPYKAVQKQETRHDQNSEVPATSNKDSTSITETNRVYIHKDTNKVTANSCVQKNQ